MASRPPGPFVLEVKFQRREDGGLRARCDKVPGFVLSHKDAEKVLADVEPALTVILSAMYGMPMKVQRADQIDRSHEAQMPAFLCDAQYVGSLEAH